MKNLRGTLSLLLLLVVYLLVSLRLFPGDWVRTLKETLLHLATIAPYTVGATIILAAALRRLADGRKVSWPLVLRLFITVSVILELFLGIHDYVS